MAYKQKKRSLDCSNERFGLKKGGYLLSRIALFDKVYHRTNWAVEGKQKSVHLIAQMNAS